VASLYPDSIPHRLLRQAEQRPSTPAYMVKVDGHWRPTPYRRFVDEVRTAARALIALGLPHGGKVALLGFNRPEWVIVDHAAMMAGGAAAGIYTTCSPDEVQYIVHHAEARVVLVEDAAQLAKLEARRAQLPLLRWIVLMQGATGAGEGVLAWADFLARADGVPEADLDQRIDAIAQADLATLIYTSGTTGPPKGVMLSHGNLAWTARTLADVGGAVDGDVSLSYLPLSHVAEQMASIHLPATVGSTVYFAESIERVPDNLKEARPTVFFGVPRIWEKFHAALAAKFAEATGVKRTLLAWTRKICAEVNARRDRGQPLGAALTAQYQLVDRIVLRKLKAAIGFDRARSCISGAAPIAADVLAFFASIDIPVREIYGQSEDSGPTSLNLPGKTRLGSVGPPLPGLQVRIAADGEIQIKGPNVFLGYYKEPAATAEALVDGWLGSGDLGAFDADGFLSITGRKKEILITAGGKNIAPKNLEAAMKESPLVAEVVVMGDRRKFLTALVTLDEAAARKLVPDGDLHAAAPIRAAVQAHVDTVNPTLARVEQIKKFTILPRPFAIDTGELTPTLKIKRAVVAAKYAAEIEAMYEGEGDPR
jgi:long-chain acyl-CoA synthetase